MRYLLSATICSIDKTCLSVDCIMYTGWSGGIVYAAAIVGLTIATLVSFPGYVSNGNLDKFYSWTDTF
jgi:hypothetical protein